MCAAILFGGGLPVSATNAAIEEKKEERKEVESRLGDVRREMDEGRDESERLNGARREMDIRVEASEMEYNELIEMLRLYEEAIMDTELALDEAIAICDEQRELLKSRVRSMYMNSNGSALEALLSSKDITSFMEMLELFSVISNHDKEVLENYKLARADVDYKRSLQMAAAERTEEIAGVQQIELDAFNVSRTELENRIVGLHDKINRLDLLEDELEWQSNKLQKEIKELVAKAEAEAEAARQKAEAERKAAAEKAAKEAAQAAAATVSGGSGGSGDMRWPAPGYRRVSSAYGNRMHPVYKRNIFHAGIDIAAPSGSNIAAAKSGTVIIARVEGGYGNTVVIDHGGGLTTLYGHCSKILVKTGQKVKAGDTIARVGSTGVSTGPHLHFEVRKNGSPVNPNNYL